MNEKFPMVTLADLRQIHEQIGQYATQESINSQLLNIAIAERLDFIAVQLIELSKLTQSLKYKVQ